MRFLFIEIRLIIIKIILLNINPINDPYNEKPHMIKLKDKIVLNVIRKIIMNRINFNLNNPNRIEIVDANTILEKINNEEN
ncbi:MAG: hypothetical protein EU529_04160 [Promethearchaeota archaeon]|nr:MAG: hypothetical protein EU529_04160 [Candidatus Lokiarchaeota archaeon]